MLNYYRKILRRKARNPFSEKNTNQVLWYNAKLKQNKILKRSFIFIDSITPVSFSNKVKSIPLVKEFSSRSESVGIKSVMNITNQLHGKNVLYI